MRQLAELYRPDLVDLAVELLGSDPFARLAEGTRHVQPAIFCASLAGWERVDRQPVSLVAGHSLGEFAALVAGGALSAEDGLRLVCTRGVLMERAAAVADTGMLAVMGGGLPPGQAIADETDLEIANDNSADQVVLAGPRAGLRRAAALATERGMRAVMLSVQGAYHSSAMVDVVDEFREALESVRFRRPSVPVLSGMTGRPLSDPPRELSAALTRRVRWRETLLAMHAAGIRHYVEAGPGRRLVDLAVRTLPGDIRVETVDQPTGTVV
jgi:malonyl CoA-acyl carrier protein transacylase